VPESLRTFLPCWIAVRESAHARAYVPIALRTQI